MRLYISHILDRSNCIQRDKAFYIKDLRILKNRSLAKTVILDCSAFSFQCQLANGIYILSYKGGCAGDSELKRIMQFLLTLEKVADVRHLTKKFAGVVRAFRLYSNEIGSLRREERGGLVAVTEPDDENMAVGEELY